MKKTILIALATLSVIAPKAATVAWNSNVEPDIAGYKVYYGTGTNFISVALGNVTTTQITLTPGVTYTFYVTAYNSGGLESAPSGLVNYTEYLDPPAINVLKPVDKIVYDKAKNQWVNYKVSWTAAPKPLSAYGAAYYTLVVSSPGATNNYLLSSSNSYTFPTLPVKDYTFSVFIEGFKGNSPVGASYFQNGKPPQGPKGFIVKP